MNEHVRQIVMPEPRRWRRRPRRLATGWSGHPGAWLERYLRIRSAKGMPRSMKDRFRAMRIPEQTITEVLGGIRGLGGWMDGWNLAAQRFSETSSPR